MESLGDDAMREIEFRNRKGELITSQNDNADMRAMLRHYVPFVVLRQKNKKDVKRQL